MGALRVAFEGYDASNSGIERVEVLRFRHVINVTENLYALNFDLAETLIHRLHAGVVGGCVVVSGAGGGVNPHRVQAVAKRVHPRTRLALLAGGAAAFGTIALVSRDLPLRRHRHLLSQRQNGGVVLSDGCFRRTAQCPSMGFRGPPDPPDSGRDAS